MKIHQNCFLIFCFSAIGSCSSISTPNSAWGVDSADIVLLLGAPKVNPGSVVSFEGTLENKGTQPICFRGSEDYPTALVLLRSSDKALLSGVEVDHFTFLNSQSTQQPVTSTKVTRLDAGEALTFRLQYTIGSESDYLSNNSFAGQYSAGDRLIAKASRHFFDCRFDDFPEAFQADAAVLVEAYSSPFSL